MPINSIIIGQKRRVLHLLGTYCCLSNLAKSKRAIDRRRGPNHKSNWQMEIILSVVCREDISVLHFLLLFLAPPHFLHGQVRCSGRRGRRLRRLLVGHAELLTMIEKKTFSLEKAMEYGTAK